MDKVICHECQAAGEKSTVRDLGGSVTCLGWSAHYDEEGVRHSHDPNRHTSGYECSRGHRWERRWYPRCHCGFSYGDTNAQ